MAMEVLCTLKEGRIRVCRQHRKQENLYPEDIGHETTDQSHSDSGDDGGGEGYRAYLVIDMTANYLG